jgi:hypothetical protein
MFHRSSTRRAQVPVLALALATLAACVTQADSEDFRKTEIELEAARERAAIECTSSGACSEAWSRTRVFVQSHSPTPVERVTDDTIETRMPHEFGVAYFWAARQTTANGTTTIRLKGMCRGMYSTDGGPGWTYAHCAEQLREVQFEFARELGGARPGGAANGTALPAR